MKNKKTTFKAITYLVFCLTLFGIKVMGYNTPKLPAPSGKFGIGRSLFHWTDTSRAEELTEEKDDNRELLVYLFYPTEHNAVGTPAPYFPHLREIEAFEDRFGKDFFKKNYGDSYAAISNMRTNTFEDAKILTGNNRFPVLIFSHGGGMPVLFYSVIIEELVSHGYIVAAVEHIYDGSTQVFPNGRTVTQKWDNYPKDSLKDRNDFLFARQKVGAQDNSFVLSQLEKLNKGNLPEGPKQFKNRIDVKRAGTLGHSLGGKTSISSCQQDKRFKFCLNLDGGMGEGLSYGTVSQPVAGIFGSRRMIKKSGETDEAFEKRKASNAKFTNNLKSEFKEVSAGSYLIFVDSPGFSHFSFWDFPTAEETGPWHVTTEQAAHNKEIILAFTLAAFDTNLLSKKSDGVKNLLKKYPEVWTEPLSQLTQTK